MHTKWQITEGKKCVGGCATTQNLFVRKENAREKETHRVLSSGDHVQKEYRNPLSPSLSLSLGSGNNSSLGG